MGFSDKGLDDEATDISMDDSIGEIKTRILDLAWCIPSVAVSRATETVISLLVEEAFNGD